MNGQGIHKGYANREKKARGEVQCEAHPRQVSPPPATRTLSKAPYVRELG